MGDEKDDLTVDQFFFFFRFKHAPPPPGDAHVHGSRGTFFLLSWNLV